MRKAGRRRTEPDRQFIFRGQAARKLAALAKTLRTDEKDVVKTALERLGWLVDRSRTGHTFLMRKGQRIRTVDFRLWRGTREHA